MNIALVDDMPQDLQALEQLIKAYCAIHQLDVTVRSFSDAQIFLEAYQPLQYTIIFLDIFMDALDGIETASRIRTIDDDVLLVFLTTSEEHRAQAFEQYASAYLVKPCREETLYRTMDHLLHIRTDREEKRFFFIHERQEKSLAIKDIVCLRSEGNYLIVEDKSGASFKIRMLFSEAEKVLGQDKRFLTIIRGVQVNLDYVVKIKGDACLLKGGSSYPLSLKRSRTIQEIWHNYNFDKIRRESLLKGGSA